jgi:exodeoxyribonuclease V gamma subunit
LILSAQALTPGFMVIHGNQPELLRQLLVQWFQAHPLAPLEDEIILVQSNGIAQWLKLALASPPGQDGGGCGIAAALDMCLPARFVWQAYRAVLGSAQVPASSPFDKPWLIWRLLRLLPELADGVGYAPIASFLADDREARKRYQLAEKIADLFDQYQVYRADWLEAWAYGQDGQDILTDAHGNPRPLGPDDAWQAQLWRTLLKDVGEARHTSRATVHQRFLAHLATLQQRPSGLPRRISIFGISALPRQQLEVLTALARFCQIVLCVHNPCEHDWSELISGTDYHRRLARRHARKHGSPAQISDENLHLHGHPLLAAWGRQGRDYIALVSETDQPARYQAQFEQLGQQIDLFVSHGSGSLLHQLQDDIRTLRCLDETRATWPAVDPATDRSIRCHIAHSPQREVEILHDQLQAALDADPTLRPRDIIVMVPDIDAYAPHIAAVFGQIDATDARYIPYTIADQGQRHQAPLAYALEQLLQLPESRLAASDVLDLLDVPALCQRFGITPADLPLLRQWIDQTHIRWGLDAAHRQRCIGQPYAQNTWASGLQRMLLGYAVGIDPAGREDHDWQGIEPYGEIAGLGAALVGPLAHLLRSLARLCETLQQPASPADWGQRLHGLLADFFTPVSAEDSLLLIQLQTSLHAWVEACAAARLDEALPLAVIREHWLSQIDQPALTRRFLAGQLTFATLMPMRAIPFRMVCLLGMNDGAYPRARAAVDFDLMARELRSGDRSRREDDRYLFLEALLSARERLHISWVGRSIQDNSERPPSVLVSQLRDHLSQGWRLVTPHPAPSLLAALTVEHRLQAFDPAYFGTDPAHADLYTYAREWQHGPSASPEQEISSLPLPAALLETPLSLRQLSSFLKNPVKTFFNTRLQVYDSQEDPTSNDHEPFDLDALKQWQLQDQLIQARLDALLRDECELTAVERQLARIRRCGELPIGSSADLLERALSEPLEAMFELYKTCLGKYPQALDDLEIQHTQVLHGHTVQVRDRIRQRRSGSPDNSGICHIELCSRHLIEKNKYRCDQLFAPWVRHLAGHLDGTSVTTCVIGKNGMVQIAPLDTEKAHQHFSAMVAAYVEGLRTPLPLSPKTGLLWLEKGGDVSDGPLDQNLSAAVTAARARYEGSDHNTGECDLDPYLQRAYPDFERLWANGRFSHWCDQLLAPLCNNIGNNVGNNVGQSSSSTKASAQEGSSHG